MLRSVGVSARDGASAPHTCALHTSANAILSQDFMRSPVVPVNMHAMPDFHEKKGVIRAIAFDLDNTLWEIEPVLNRAERILADWLGRRYPRIHERFTPADVLAMRAALLTEQPHQAHDLSFLRRETIARCAVEAGYERDIA